MKKITTLFALGLLVLGGCSAGELLDDVKKFFAEEEAIEEEVSNEDIEELKEKIEELEAQVEEQSEEEETEEDVEEEVAEEEADVLSYITVTSPEEGTSYFDVDQIEFNGQVSADATKIVVTAYYEELSFEGPDGEASEDFGEMVYTPMVDVYELQNFEAGDNEFVYRASMAWDNLGHGTNEYVFTAYFEDGSELSDKLSIEFEMDGLGKPVVYLYPEETTTVSVNVEPNLGVFYSEPELAGGWTVVAEPNGLLFDLSTRSYYPYLYWEGFSTALPEYEEGFCVAQGDLRGFFEEKLAVLGLNESEMGDFFEYWEPRLDDAPYYLINFVEQEVLDELAPLTLEPKPDTVIRVFFDWEELDAPLDVEPQQLEEGVRDGFTVIEWGGTLF